MRGVLLVVLLFTVAAGATGLADEPSDDASVARRHFNQGVLLHQYGDYPAALAEFEASYRAQPLPTIRYNIGLTEMALFRYRDAIETFRSYLASDDPASADRRSEVARLIDQMSALLVPLRLSVTPDGAQVQIDGRSVGVAPLPPLELAAGPRRLDVTADGYRPEHRALTVVAGAPLELAVALSPLPRVGWLHLGVTPAHAAVRVDGRARGAAPLDFELQTGRHIVDVAADGFRPQHSELTLSLGEHRSLALALEALPRPVWRRWWFWTTAATVVVVGSVVVLGILTAFPYVSPSGSLGTYKVD